MNASARIFGLLPILLLGATSAQEVAPPAASETPAALSGKLLRDNRPLTDVVSPALSFGAIADKILPSVVAIQTPGAVPAARGSGILVSGDGYVLTTSAVISDASSIEVLVRLDGKIQSFAARIVRVDPAASVGLLKIEAARLPQATIGDSSQVRADDLVIAAGGAKTPHRSATQGVVSTINTGTLAINTDIAIAPLDAGGPLVDRMGRVIGINVPSGPGDMGALAGSAIPINAAIAAFEPAAPQPTTPRGFLGIQINDVTLAGAPPKTPDEPHQVIVQMVGAESPAETAGLKVGDVISAIDGTAISDSSVLRRLMGEKQPGDEAAIEVLRDGRPLKVTAVLTELPTETAAATPPPLLVGKPGEMLPGLTIDNLTPEVRQQYAVPQAINGVLVTQVEPDSRAAAMAIQQGDVIMQVNRKPVASVDEAHDIATKGDKTVLIKVYRQGDTMLFMVGR